MTTKPFVLNPTVLAQYLSWKLSNSNHELETPEGEVIDASFNAQVEGAVIKLGVDTLDEHGRSSSHTFQLTIVPCEDPEKE
jgi:hypothetical protein